MIASFVAAAQTRSSRPPSTATQTGASSIKLIASRSLSTCTASTTSRISFERSRPSLSKAATPVSWTAINEWSRSIRKLRNQKPTGTLLVNLFIPHERIGIALTAPIKSCLVSGKATVCGMIPGPSARMPKVHSSSPVRLRLKCQREQFPFLLDTIVGEFERPRLSVKKAPQLFA